MMIELDDVIQHVILYMQARDLLQGVSCEPMAAA